jgi:hypothetical protein
MPLSEHVSRLRLDWGPSLRDHRNDVATTGEGDPAITKSKPSLMAYERPTPITARSQRSQNETAAS